MDDPYADAAIAEDRVNATKFIKAMNGAGFRRRVCVTGRGYLGLVPEEAEVGDRLVVFLGARVVLCCERWRMEM